MRKASHKELWLLAQALNRWTGPRLPGAPKKCLRPERYNRDQLAIGVKIEHEHTRDPALALEIAQAHLCERRDYYHLLEKLEAA